VCNHLIAKVPVYLHTYFNDSYEKICIKKKVLPAELYLFIILPENNAILKRKQNSEKTGIPCANSYLRLLYIQVSISQIKAMRAGKQTNRMRIYRYSDPFYLKSVSTFDGESSHTYSWKNELLNCPWNHTHSCREKNTYMTCNMVSYPQKTTYYYSSSRFPKPHICTYAYILMCLFIYAHSGHN